VRRPRHDLADVLPDRRLTPWVGWTGGIGFWGGSPLKPRQMVTPALGGSVTVRSHEKGLAHKNDLSCLDLRF
jgi:hypothetical protein